MIGGTLTSSFSAMGALVPKMMGSVISKGQLVKEVVFNGLVAGAITTAQNLVNGYNGYDNIVIDTVFAGVAKGLRIGLVFDTEMYEFIYDVLSTLFNM